MILLNQLIWKTDNYLEKEWVKFTLKYSYHWYTIDMKFGRSIFSDQFNGSFTLHRAWDQELERDWDQDREW